MDNVIRIIDSYLLDDEPVDFEYVECSKEDIELMTYSILTAIKHGMSYKSNLVQQQLKYCKELLLND